MTRSVPRPIVESAAGRAAGCGSLFVILFFSVFLAVGVGALAFLWPDARDAWNASRWVEVPAVVESGELVTHEGDEGPDTYSAKLTYRYQYQGQSYTSDRRSFLGTTGGSRPDAMAMLEAHPPGTEIRCWVDPAHPDRAVLDKSVGLELALLVIPLIFIAVGGGGMVFGLRAIGRARKAASGTAPLAGGQAAVVRRHGPLPVERAGTVADHVVLRSTNRPATTLIVLLVFGAIWNTAISFFLLDIVKDWREGDLPILQSLFFLPFAAVGLGILAGIVYQALALTNPKVEVTLQRGELWPGGRVRLAWRLIGRTAGIRRWTITLEGREEATYRRGTDTTTDKHVFHRAVAFETEDAVLMATGQCDLRLPADGVPTFTAANNKIVYELQVRGEIHRWPDVSADFPVEVGAPPPGGAGAGPRARGGEEDGP